MPDFVSTELSRADELDGAVATGQTCCMVAIEQQAMIHNQKMVVAHEIYLCVVKFRRMSHVRSVASILYQPVTPKRFWNEVLGDTMSAVYIFDELSEAVNGFPDWLFFDADQTCVELLFRVGFL